MKKNVYDIYILIFFMNIFYIKTDYVVFELNTFKNSSTYEKDQINYFYDSLSNILYSIISLGPQHEQYIMELKIDTIGLTIYNFNCDIPPVNSENFKPYLPNFADSIVVDHIDDNETQIYGEYFMYLLNNTLKVKTEKGEKTLFIDYLFSQRNDTKYIKNIILRPYTCFNLGFHLLTKEIIEDEYALNLIFQLKKQNITNSYSWFIEYDTKNKERAKLILGSKPYEYNSDKYKESNEKTVQAEKRLDRIIYWDIKMDEIYLMENKEKKMIEGYNTCSLEPTLGVILGANGYKIYVEEKLFAPLMKQEKCFKEKIENKYIMFYCDKNMKETLKKSEYVKIFFNQRFFGETFELGFDDIFEEKGNFIYFKIFFDQKQTDLWRLGKPFLIKYFFSFDFDGKTISYYKLEESGEKEDNNNSNIKTYLIIIIIALALIFLILGFFFGKYLYIYRKKRMKNAEELLDNEKIGDESINVNGEEN